MNRSLLFILVECLFNLIDLASFHFFLPQPEFLLLSCVFTPSCISSSFNPQFALANSIKSCGIVFAFMSLLCHAGKWDSSLGIVTRLKAGPRGVTILGEMRDFLLSKTSRLDVGLAHPPIQYMFGVLSSSGQSGRFVSLTSHLHLMLRLRMKGAVPPFLHMSSWHIQG